MSFYEVEFIHTIQPTLYEIPTESSSVNNVKQKNVYIACLTTPIVFERTARLYKLKSIMYYYIDIQLQSI